MRAVEIGSLMFGDSKDAEMELVRLAIPRRVYTGGHMNYVAQALKRINARRDTIKGMRIVWEPPFLRHFSAKLAFVD